MKKLFTTLTTLALLMAAMVANAQTTGKLQGDGASLTYSFSGGTIISSGESVPGYQAGYTCEVSPGDVITFQCVVSGKRASGNDCALQSASIKAYQGKNASWDNNPVLYQKEEKGVTSASFSYTVPKEPGYVRIEATVHTNQPTGSHACLSISIGFRVNKDKPTPQPEPKPQKFGDCDCTAPCVDESGDRVDSKISFNDLYGEVKIRPNWEEDDAYEFAEFDTKIYECDRIKTEEESGAILGLEDMNVVVMKENTTFIILTETPKVTNLELFAGGIWANIKKLAEGKSIDCEMSHCITGIKGTIVAFEETGRESKVWLFAGKVEVTNKQTKKKTMLQPGQSITCKGSTLDVKTFDIEQGAKKFGIPMSEIENHYSNSGNKAIPDKKVNKGKNEPKTVNPGKNKATTGSSQTVDDGVYVIRFTNNPEYVLTLKDGKAVNDNVVHLWKWQNSNAQKWKVTHENGKIAIRSMVDPNYALDVKNFNYSNNADIILYSFHGGDNQLWIPERLSNGSYILKTAGSSTFCLDLYQGDAKNGGKIELYNAHKLWPEWWTLEKVK